jgi:hypothetical protein
MHLRTRELRRQQLDGLGIDFATAAPGVGEEIHVFGRVHRAQWPDAVIVGIAHVEPGLHHAPVQHAVALGAFGMRDRPAAAEEARRVVIAGSGRVVDAHRGGSLSVAIKCAQNHHPVHARLRS